MTIATIVGVQRAIRHLPHVGFTRGLGCCHFRYDDGDLFEIRRIDVPYANRLSIAQWVAEAEAFYATCQQAVAEYYKEHAA